LFTFEEQQMTPKITATLGSLALAALLAGCGSTVKLDDVPVETRNPTGAAAGSGTGSPAAAAGTGQSTVTTVDLPRSTDAMATVGRIVYFDFDSYVIKDDYKALVEAHAKALAANWARSVPRPSCVR
jgi:peptidoglycan-associated lipoprotein